MELRGGRSLMKGLWALLSITNEILKVQKSP